LTGQVADRGEKKYGDARGQEGRFEGPAGDGAARNDKRECQRPEDSGVRTSHRFDFNPPVEFP
jgi:hypothetical protein